jgi:hypothetical protein
LPDVVCRIESCHEDISEFMVDKYPKKAFHSDFELNNEINSTLNKYQKRVDNQTLDDLKKINFRNYSAPIISQKDWLSLPKSTLFILEKFCKYYKYDYIL